MRDEKRDEIDKKRYIMRNEIDQKEYKNSNKFSPKKELWTVVSITITVAITKARLPSHNLVINNKKWYNVQKNIKICENCNGRK